MTRPITLFTGQWADLPFEEVARLAGEWGYDGLELACWGDHFDPWAAVEDDCYVQGRRDILEKHGLSVYAISNHLTGQAVCDDPIDARHEAILPPRVWGDGSPEGVRQRAAEAMQMTARAAARLGVSTVVGFTGSSIWNTVAMFPPVPQSMVDAGTSSPPDTATSRGRRASGCSTRSATPARSRWSGRTRDGPADRRLRRRLHPRGVGVAGHPAVRAGPQISSSPARCRPRSRPCW